jgi:hypothetical protein
LLLGFDFVHYLDVIEFADEHYVVLEGDMINIRVVRHGITTTAGIQAGMEYVQLYHFLRIF